MNRKKATLYAYNPYSVNEYAQQWRQLNNHKKEIEARLKVQASEDNELQQLYESAPGIGSIHGRQLANELCDMKQFKNEKQLFSFTGLTPSADGYFSKITLEYDV